VEHGQRVTRHTFKLTEHQSVSEMHTQQLNFAAPVQLPADSQDTAPVTADTGIIITMLLSLMVVSQLISTIELLLYTVLCTLLVVTQIFRAKPIILPFYQTSVTDLQVV